MSPASLVKSIRYLLFLFLLFAAMHFARAFLIPIAFGGLFAMLLLPLAEKIEVRAGSIPAILICMLILVMVVVGLFMLISWQISDIAGDTSTIRQQISDVISKGRNQLSTTLGISAEKQKEWVQRQQQDPADAGRKVAALFGSLMSVAANGVLVLVYIFLFLYSRVRLKNFVLKLTPEDKKDEAVRIMSESRKVAQQYLSGLGIMIACLWIMYSIGFSVAGVKNPVFFAVLCGLLEIIPFVGNIIGTVLTALMVLVQGGETAVLAGVLVTYAVIQFFQSYVLEPFVVGSKVNINPLFTILALVAGELVWGIAGMILAIPLLGIFKIICDHTDSLKPYGYLIGEESGSRTNKWAAYIRHFFKKGDK